MNDLEPTEHQPFFGPNAKLWTIHFVILTSVSVAGYYFFGYVLLGGPDGWFGKFAGGIVCRYLLAGAC